MTTFYDSIKHAFQNRRLWISGRMSSEKRLFLAASDFTPLESPGIYAGDGRNRKHQSLIEGGVKALPFLTGFT